ncbi:PAP2-domain-containing protein [Neurospora tetraspora]|uniref:PAP2-domain-containing protein n=1 Tax=Neurospora tetraspora TaxID=94610 RepID=A0AAE0J115_9PEZI|nr:PAP2-domain-containing protein [Neurospora tetraspora]
MPDDSEDFLIPPAHARSVSPSHTGITPTSTTTPMMEDLRHTRAGGPKRKKGGWVVVVSYVFDWVIIAVAGVIGYIFGNKTPNKRPFSLHDPNISFPFTVKETVPVWLAACISVLAPIVLIAVISLIFVPGATVPRGTPKAMIWKRKLWELHIGWLGLALSVASAWLITNGMKNLYGKPRPDLLSRCQPDLANYANYIVGGYANSSMDGQLVSANICKNTDKALLDDGFRSYPSGHSSSAASGLVYLSLFIASKFAITIPFLASGTNVDAASFSAFPSRTRNNTAMFLGGPESYEMASRGPAGSGSGRTYTGGSIGAAEEKRLARHTRAVAAVRRQAAAPPLYLLLICIIPWFASIFIASSRWFDFRHHGFDILFGYLIGLVCAFFAFRYYHLPISQGAGWAWGPRSRDKAFWAGVGSYSYSTDHNVGEYHRAGDEEEALGPDSLDHGSYGRPVVRGNGTGLESNVGPDQPITGRKPPSLDEREQADTAYRGVHDNQI